jgi:hypothetical protein
MKKIILLVVLALVVIGLIYFISSGDEKQEFDDGGLVFTPVEYRASLEDVSGGNATGIAQATFLNGNYTLVAVFDGLPDPEDTDFYEGWIVRRGEDQSVVSTGVISKENGVYKNTFTFEKDLADHDFYVVTIEPDDGDPAPADHILEGVLVKQ